jgi:hypothetical protein
MCMYTVDYRNIIYILTMVVILSQSQINDGASRVA